jgi:hypothetical protein
MTIMSRGRAVILGCVIVFVVSVVPAGADVVTDWNLIAQQTIGAGAATRPTPSGSLDFAMVHIAIHDAIQAFQQRFESYTAPIIGATARPLPQPRRPHATCW